MNKVYVILYNAYEIDDIDIGDLTPIYLSLSKDSRNKEYERLLSSNKNHFENCKHTNEDEFEETNEEFSYSLGNWCYHYAKDEYKLDTNLRW